LEWSKSHSNSRDGFLNELQEWMAPEITSIGAGVDSFFEYALKWYIMSGKSLIAFVSGNSNGCVGEIEFLDVWDDAYTAIMRYSRAADGYWVRGTIHFISSPADYIKSQYKPVSTKTGDTAFATVDSLSAFWPGLQVLAGDVQSGIRLHLLCGLFLVPVKRRFDGLIDYNLWREHSGLPEVYDTKFRQATAHQYPLRPGISILFRD
jgi:mannosidase alpha-like ER degradation enhancer 1